MPPGDRRSAPSVKQPGLSRFHLDSNQSHITNVQTTETPPQLHPHYPAETESMLLRLWSARVFLQCTDEQCRANHLRPESTPTKLGTIGKFASRLQSQRIQWAASPAHVHRHSPASGISSSIYSIIISFRGRLRRVAGAHYGGMGKGGGGGGGTYTQTGEGEGTYDVPRSNPCPEGRGGGREGEGGGRYR